MARGFVAGAIWGLVVSAAGAGAVSLAVGVAPIVEDVPGDAGADVAALPEDPGPEAMPEAAPAAEIAPDPGAGTPPAPEAEAQLPDTPPVRFEASTDTVPEAAAPPEPARRPAAETDIDAPEVAALDAPDTSTDATLSDEAREPAAVPDPALDSADLPSPDATAQPAGVDVSTEAPVLPSVQTLLPSAPGAEAEPSIATEPAQPPVPLVPSEDSGLVAEDAAAAESADTPEAEEVTEAPAPEETEDAPAELTLDAVAEAEPAAPEADAPVEMAEQAPEAQDDAPEMAAVAPEPAEQTPLAAEEDPAPTVRILNAPSTTSEEDGAGRPAIGTPAVSLIDRGSAVPEGRLPSVGTVADEAPGAESGTSPLAAHAAEVDVAADLPRMSIVLIDDGSGPLGPDTLDAFPFPVTFALDPSAPGAAARMRGYRDKGFEVMALVGVPAGAQPTDVEVTLGASLSGLPQAVAVLESPRQGLQGSRAVSDQVTQVLRDSGHGLVMQPKGLNTATALALREGVPAATLFKDFDGEGQDPRTIRRFLDGAAFRARQDGAVVVLGRLKADTLSALLLWGLQDRAAQVALVPVSLVLREAAGQ
ncbi:divergent polysaccharide deacetylase family protein [Thalassococcus sp. BH17M4-6]|uniref:divergent polysaccharide deacetylase family protein n=1 Tax=Thalassococcus sp. BH17M4-6 TaxID=3413148 RepID=UPI003BEE686B